MTATDRALAAASLVGAAAGEAPSDQAQVNTPNAAHREMERHWHLPSTLMGGTLAMRAARDTYLPPYPYEDKQAYERRLARSFLHNFYADAVTGLAARPFTRPVTISDETPEELKQLANAVDTEGRTLTQVGHDLLLAGIEEGLAHIVVDFPRAPEGGRTLADEKRENVRPFWVLVRASNVIAWRSKAIGADEVLTHVRIREWETVPVGEWGEETVERIRVYDLNEDGVVTYRLFGLTGDDQWSEIESGELVGIKRIPLVTFYTRRTGFMTGLPPLEDLAWLNLAHWQSSSEQRNFLAIARAGILFGAGFSEEEIGEPVIGNRAWLVTNPAAKLGWVEHTGSAMEVGFKDLEKLEASMAALAMRPLISKPGDQTATAKAIDTAETYQSLTQWVRNLEATLVAAMKLSAEWKQLDGSRIGVDVAEDFGISVLDRKEIADLITMWEKRAISHATFLAEVKRRGFFAHGFSETEEIDRVRMDREEGASPEVATAPSRGQTDPIDRDPSIGSNPRPEPPSP